MTGTTVGQLTTPAVVLSGNLVIGLLPLLVVKSIGYGDQANILRNRISSFILNFSAGVFMSICLLFLIPKSHDLFELSETAPNEGETIHAEESADHKEEFSLSEFTVMCGFFATFALEEVLNFLVHIFRKRNEGRRDERVRFCSCAKRHMECSRTYKAENPDQTMFGMEKEKLLNSNNTTEFSGINRTSDQTASANPCLLQSSILSQPVPNYGSVTNITDPQPDQPVMAPAVVIAADGNVALIHHHHHHEDNSRDFISIHNTLLLVVLCAHAVSQGWEMGKDSQTVSWLSLLLHSLNQFAVVFSIGGVVLSDSQHSWKVFCFVAALSVMWPLGYGLARIPGYQEVLQLSYIHRGVFYAIICGSLLNLTFYGLLKRSKMKCSSHVDNFVGFVFGSISMASLLYASTVL